MSHQCRTDNQTAAALVTLTPRELEVLQLLAQGLSNKAIADKLFMSPRTVQAHLRSVYRKFGVSSRTSAAVKAVLLCVVSHV